MYIIDAYRKDQVNRGTAVPKVKRAEGRESDDREWGRRGSFGKVNLERGEGIRHKREHETPKDDVASGVR